MLFFWQHVSPVRKCLSSPSPSLALLKAVLHSWLRRAMEFSDESCVHVRGTPDRKGVQGWTLWCAPGSVNMRRKHCVFCLWQAGERNFFTSYSQNLEHTIKSTPVLFTSEWIRNGILYYSSLVVLGRDCAEIGKKAWLFAKLQPGRARKRINAT